jgi:hypothetical protein
MVGCVRSPSTQRDRPALPNAPPPSEVTDQDRQRMSRPIDQREPGLVWAIALIGGGSVRSEKGGDRVELEITERTLPVVG